MSTKQRAEAATATKVVEEDDIGALIYKESQLRKREAAAAKNIERRSSSASKHRATSTHKTTTAAIRGESSFATTESRQLIEKRKRHLPTDVDEGKEPAEKVARKKKYRYECSADGCTNHVVKGGVCKRHGAKPKIKKCSSEGCTNQVQQGGVGGVCIKHGAKPMVRQCSNEGCSNIVIRKGVCWTHGAKHNRCISRKDVPISIKPK